MYLYSSPFLPVNAVGTYDPQRAPVSKAPKVLRKNHPAY